jgi:hypothetical protein
VLGVSYGTDLALTYMRSIPEGARHHRSGAPPPMATVAASWTMQREGLTIFTPAADPACHARYPDPLGTLVSLVRSTRRRRSGRLAPAGSRRQA